MRPEFLGPLGGFHAVLGNEKAIYYSTPITSGRLFFERTRTEKSGILTAEGRRDVLERNRKSASECCAILRRRFKYVINPADFDAEYVCSGWDQQFFYEFWNIVINRFCSRIVVSEEWWMSLGCLREVANGIRTDMPIENLNGDLIPYSELRSRMEEGVGAFESVGVECAGIIGVRDKFAVK